MILDSYNRIHNYLRISLTDNCNLRCFYCMPEEDYEFTPTAQLMQVDEIVALAKEFVSLGVNKIRLTGGEPLIRKDAKEIILALSKLPVTTISIFEPIKLSFIYFIRFCLFIFFILSKVPSKSLL